MEATDDSVKTEIPNNNTSRKDWRLFNIVFLGVAFMLMFTAFQTCGMVEQSVLEGVRNETNGTYKGDGYTSLSIIYAVFAVSNWIAPSVVAVCGPKLSMIISGITYCLYVGSFLYPLTWTLYLGSVLIGIGAAIIWTGQGNFLTINSDSETIGRNSGIFWALLQCSLLFGNLYVYFTFKGEINIDPHTRLNLFIVLTVTCAVGVLVLLVLRNKTAQTSNLNPQSDQIQVSKKAKPDPLQELVKAGKLFITKDMLLLAVVFAYTGFELTFFSGVYGTSVGHTSQFHKEAKSLLGLVGILIGVGEITGGALFGLLGYLTNRFGRDPVVLLGFLVHMACFYLIFLNLPQESPLTLTAGSTYIPANKYIAVSCGFMLGFGDACFNTQIFSILGNVYHDNSAPAFALFKFIQSLAAAIGFFYSDHIIMEYQLLILVVLGVAGTLCFFAVEWRTSSRHLGNRYEKL